MSERGLSMVEILVALAIAAVGMLGLLGVQARALSMQQDSSHRRQAAELVAQLAERMRANQLASLEGAYSLRFELHDDAPAGVAACLPPCTGSGIAVRDLDEWRIELRRRVPGAAAYVRWDPSNRSGVDIAVAWPEPRATGSDPACATLIDLGAVVPAGHRCYRTRVLP